MGLARTPLFPVHVGRGAEFGELDGWLVPAHFGAVAVEATAVRRGVGIYDLGHTPVFSLIGPDARRFCNGMFTQNIRDLKPGSGRRSALTDEKGRMLGLLDVWATADDTFYALLEGVTREAFLERYGKFIILDDVELEDRTDATTLLSVQGPGAAELVRAVALPVPEGDAVVAAAELFVHPRARSVAGGFDLLVPVAAVSPLWEALCAAGGVPVGLDAQEVLRIEAGRARWPVDMGERALVHEMRLVPECCAFDKGCYVGQEVINRIDVMGQVNKKLWGLDLHEDAIPPLEAEVRLGGEVVGVVRSGAREGTRVRALALLRKPAWTPGAQVEVHAGGRVVGATVRELPFGEEGRPG